MKSTRYANKTITVRCQSSDNIEDVLRKVPLDGTYTEESDWEPVSSLDELIPPPPPKPLTRQPAGRNDPCPCGSRKKFKRCCKE